MNTGGPPGRRSSICNVYMHVHISYRMFQLTVYKIMLTLEVE